MPDSSPLSDDAAEHLAAKVMPEEGGASPEVMETPSGVPDRSSIAPRPEVLEQLANLPPTPGCYLFYNRKGEVLYVGKAISLRNRVRSYFHHDKNRAPKIRRLVQQIRRIEWVDQPTEMQALVEECRLIKHHLPRFNALLKGDRRLARLRVTVEETFPRVFLDWEEPGDESRYFGPFTRRDSAEGLLDVLYRVFRLRSCDQKFTGREGMRPCLYYDMKQCLGPCNVQCCSVEEYREAVDAAMDFLSGKQEELALRLLEEMETAAESLQFERAARLRDMRGTVLRWMERQHFLALWENPNGRETHLFLAREGQLSGHCVIPATEKNEDGAAWRLRVMKTLRDTYAAPVQPAHLLGSIAVEELGIMEAWLSRKKAHKAFVTAPQGPDDGDALARMLAEVETWMTAPLVALEPQADPVPDAEEDLEMEEEETSNPTQLSLSLPNAL